MDILFLALIAAFIAYKYFSVLGKKDDHLDNIEAELHKINLELNNMSNQELQQAIKDAIVIEPITTSSNTKVIEVMTRIHSVYPEFNESFFLQGANKLFDILIKAYAEGNIDVISGWTNKELGQKLIQDIESRKSNKQILDITIISLKANIVDAEMIDNQKKACISVKFESEQVSILTDNANKVIQGDPKKVDKINEVWVFEKDLTVNTLNWILQQIKPV